MRDRSEWRIAVFLTVWKADRIDVSEGVAEAEIISRA
jgi:hypothetical protein